MANKKKSIRAKTGKPPGSLVYTGEQEINDSKVTFIDYNNDFYECREIKTIEQLKNEINNVRQDTVSWVNINGLQNIELLKEIGSLFEIHNLILEDILNVYHRPKVEVLEDYIFAVIKHISGNVKENLRIDHIGIIVSHDFVITFQDCNDNVFESIYPRIENIKGLVRKHRQDYLFYALMDFIVDHYFVVTEDLNEEIDRMQEELFDDAGKDYLEQVHKLKKEISKIKQAVKPSREILLSLLREDIKMIDRGTVVYFRDTLDHLIQLTETIDLARESVISLLDTYLSTVSNKMNEVMKVLTIIATIFIPLTFIAGVYGMNFKNIPELEWDMGYPLVWGIMLFVGVMLVLFFKKKKWL